MVRGKVTGVKGMAMANRKVLKALFVHHGIERLQKGFGLIKLA